MIKGKGKKRIYGVCINARLMNDMFMNMGDFKRAAKRGNVDEEFEKRIMLAVTQVNGCEMCSFYHTAEALKAGMSSDEINMILEGKFSDIPQSQLTAVLFAQHYAETIARPQKDVYNTFENEYGNQAAQDILCYIRAIMLGNAQGNIVGAFKSRVKGKPELGSTVFKELSVLLCDVLLIPLLLLKALALQPIKGLMKSKHD